MRSRTLPKEKCRVEQFLDSFKEEPGNEHGWTGSKNWERLAKRLGVGRPWGSRRIIFLFPLRPLHLVFHRKLENYLAGGVFGWLGLRSGRAVCMP
jgi:hypothetical protein